jgi:hypothetical protein
VAAELRSAVLPVGIGWAHETPASQALPPSKRCADDPRGERSSPRRHTPRERGAVRTASLVASLVFLTALKAFRARAVAVS